MASAEFCGIDEKKRRGKYKRRKGIRRRVYETLQNVRKVHFHLIATVPSKELKVVEIILERTWTTFVFTG